MTPEQRIAMLEKALRKVEGTSEYWHQKYEDLRDSLDY